jgi:hypothetical protein
MTESRLESLYQQHLKKGYQPLYAKACAENDLNVIEGKEFIEVNKPSMILIAGVGLCAYTGD